VRKIQLAATFVAALLGLAAGGAAAQDQGTNVAIIDLSMIFKNHKGFNALMDEMKASVSATEQELKLRQEKLQTMAKNLKDSPDFKPGTPEYMEVETQITQESAALQADIALKKKEFMQREAGIYYQIYQEVYQEVKYFCQQHQIGLVLRYNSDPPDPNNPQEVLKDLNKMVVFHDQLDITGSVLENLNSRQARPSGQKPPRTGVRPPSTRPQ
jgi:Skp family chaperone for outer membrane proteins